MTFQPGAVLNTQGFGSRPENLEVPHYDVRVPATTDTNYPVGKEWIFTGNSIWKLLSLSSAGGTLSANWVQVSTQTSSGALVVSGSITSSSGNITATNGNFVASTSGSGIVLSPIDVAAAASPQTANGRSGKVTFSGVSIAAGATQTFVINNTSVGATTTDVLFSNYGATAGSALTVSNFTTVANTSMTFVVTNGTGATTDTANITFVFLLLD